MPVSQKNIASRFISHLCINNWNIADIKYKLIVNESTKTESYANALNSNITDINEPVLLSSELARTHSPSKPKIFPPNYPHQ